MILTSTLAAVAAITTSQANLSEVVFLLDVSGSTDISQKALVELRWKRCRTNSTTTARAMFVSRS